MDWLDEGIAAEWRKLSKQYIDDLNEFIRIGDETGWTKAPEQKPRDQRLNLAHKVMDMITDANAIGDFERLHDLVPPASSPLIAYFGEQADRVLQPIFPRGFIGEHVLLQTGHPTTPNCVYLALHDEITLIPGIRHVGLSPDGMYIALANEKGITVMQDFDRRLHGTTVAYFPWDMIQSTLRNALPHHESLGTIQSAVDTLVQIIPFEKGQSLLIISEYGVYLIRNRYIRILSPSPEELEEYGPEYTSTFVDMAHGAISQDEHWIAYGHQGSEHMLLHVPTDVIHSFAPASSYPHYSLFNKASNGILYNACHLYDGVTSYVDLAAVERGEIGPYDDLPALDEEMRIYAGVAVQQGTIVGDGYGYFRLIDKNGREIWRHFVGSVVAGLMVSPDERWLIVGTYSGMAHWMDLHHGSVSEYNVGNAPILETNRWMIWTDREPLRW